MSIKVNINGSEREFTITKMDQDLPHLRKELISKGFDGDCYMGISKPQGRQRKTFTAIFYRQSNGQFVNAL